MAPPPIAPEKKTPPKAGRLDVVPHQLKHLAKVRAVFPLLDTRRLAAEPGLGAADLLREELTNFLTEALEAIGRIAALDPWRLPLIVSEPATR
jgi:hypothetical protein